MTTVLDTLKKHRVVRRAAEFIRARRRSLDIRAEVARTRRSAGFLRELPEPPAGAPTALIPCLGDWVYGVKTEAMLAVGLKMAGWSVAFVLPRTGGAWAEEMLRAFGFSRFHRWEDFEMTPAEMQRLTAEAEALLEQAKSFTEMKRMSYAGCWIGPQVLSTLARSLYDTDFDPCDPQVRAALRRTLVRCLATIEGAKRLFHAHPPRLVCVNEANYAHYAAIVDVAIREKIGVLQFIQPARDDAFYFWKLRPETRRLHPSTVSREAFDKVKAIEWTAAHEGRLQSLLSDRYSGRWFLQNRNQLGTAAKAKETLIAELQLDPAKKTACVFSHVLWDANLFYGDDLFADYGEWFVETVKAACRNPAVNWLIKYHPANAWKRARENVTAELAEDMLIRNHVGALPPHVKILTPSCGISTESIFEAIDYGITVRGTAGLELPCYGVPIFTAGTGRYSGLGFSIDSQTKEEYLRRMAGIQEQPPLTAAQQLLAKKHAYAAFCLRPWIMKSFRAEFRAARYHSDPLDYNLVPQAASLADIRQLGDLAEFAAWAASDGAPDYFSEPTVRD